jgi:hypothetical protein
MNYFDHNDRKNADARIRAQIHNAERAKSRDFDGTLLMTAREVWRARIGGAIKAYAPQSIMPPRAREPRCEFSANRAMAGGR